MASTRPTSSGRSAASPSIGSCPTAMLVVKSNNEGVPFVLASPDAPISKDLLRVAAELLDAGKVFAAAGRS